MVSVLSMALMTGGAAGLRAEAGPPALALPDSPETIRVRVLYTKAPTHLDSTGPWEYQARRGGMLYAGPAALRVSATRSAMNFGHKSFEGEVVVLPTHSTDTLKLNGRRYRGILVFHPLSGGRYDVVEYVGLQEYLYGVLPREVGTDWPLEALKAQAVVSRTYALSNKAEEAKGRFDLSDGVFDQVYGGMNVEAPTSNRAVDETRGEALLDPHGKPIQAFFHSSCGGRTELPKNVWKSSVSDDLFGCVADPYCQEDPHYQWKVQISYDTIRKRLRKAGIRVSTIQKVSVMQKSISGRAVTFGVQTGKGIVPVSGNRFRMAMGADSFRSTLLTNMKASKTSVLFEGHGWGHGVGLCQWGARGRAIAGQTYATILKAYYPGGSLKKIEDSAR